MTKYLEVTNVGISCSTYSINSNLYIGEERGGI